MPVICRALHMMLVRQKLGTTLLGAYGEFAGKAGKFRRRIGDIGDRDEPTEPQFSLQIPCSPGNWAKRYWRLGAQRNWPIVGPPRAVDALSGVPCQSAIGAELRHIPCVS
jgi:hypothetical protein